MLTKDDLLKNFNYDKVSGKLYWRVTKNSQARHGMEAGGVAMLGGVPYRRIKVDGRSYLTHRLIFFIETGNWPEIVDHINRDTLDNRFGNLRAATKMANRWNCTGNRQSISGVKGVYYDRGRWKALITVKGQRQYLGMYATLEEAKKVVDTAYMEQQGEFSLQHSAVLTDEFKKEE